MTLKDLPASERPRERLLQVGAEALSDAELLAILLRTGTPRATAVQVAQRLLKLGAERAGHPLRYLLTAPADELAAEPGVGLAKAAQIKAALELGRRLQQAAPARPRVHSPEDAAALVMAQMRHLDREQFQVLLLDTKHQVLAIELISVGSLNSTVVHPRELFKIAIRRSAHAVILVHNHPSGDPTPSREDVDLTRRLVQAGRILGIEVLDHLVIGDGRFVSLRRRGDLGFGGGADWI